MCARTLVAARGRCPKLTCRSALWRDGWLCPSLPCPALPCPHPQAFDKVRAVVAAVPRVTLSVCALVLAGSKVRCAQGCLLCMACAHLRPSIHPRFFAALHTLLRSFKPRPQCPPTPHCVSCRVHQSSKVEKYTRLLGALMGSGKERSAEYWQAVARMAWVNGFLACKLLQVRAVAVWHVHGGTALATGYCARLAPTCAAFRVPS
jgi:hypothetical protein